MTPAHRFRIGLAVAGIVLALTVGPLVVALTLPTEDASPDDPVSLGPIAREPGAVTLAVLGETHGVTDVTRLLVDLAIVRGATGCVCLGDFIHGDPGATPAAWKEMMAPLMRPMIPAQGNHDWPWEDWSDLFPREKPYYDRDVNGVQFIIINPEHQTLANGTHQRAWLEVSLADRAPDALKVLVVHRPWWLPEGARHPTREFEEQANTTAQEMAALMRQHGVDLVLAGHEKNYQHSIVDGIHHVVAGAAGPGFYPLDYALPGAVSRIRDGAASILQVAPGGLRMETFGTDGTVLDAFVITQRAA